MIKENFKKAESELNIGRSKLRECDVQISAITKELQKLQHRQSDDNVARKKMENEVLFFIDQVKLKIIVALQGFFCYDNGK